MMPTVELRGVTKRFGKVTAVEDVNLILKDGEYLAILGPSGCGKTTLAKIISGIWEPTEGEIYIDGKRMNGIPPEERNIGYVFQNIVLFPHLSVWDNATYPPRVRGRMQTEQKELGNEALALVEMMRDSGKLPDELSGGAQQKAGLARALATKARLMIFDEPLSALDARVRVELRYTLRGLVKELGLTALHVTHDQEEAMSVADRLVIMRKGRIIEYGSPPELYGSPKEIFTANFLGESNFLEGVVDRTIDSWAVVELRNEQYLRVRGDGVRRGEAVVVSVRPEHLTLARLAAAPMLIGKVQDIHFAGPYVRYEVLVRTGDVVMIDSTADEASFNTGEDVIVVFDPKHIRVYPRPYAGLQEALKLE
jgi:ABC-type Fe3+/spermidine/putrescine transport system ATPase subunit